MEREESALKSTLEPLLRSAWRLKWLLIPLGGLIAFGAWELTQRQTRIYEASVQLIIDLEAPSYMPKNGNEVVSLGSGKTWNTREFFETQYRIIRSRLVSAEVVDSLNLERDDDFLGILELPPEERAEARARADAVSTLISRISLTPIVESHVVLVKVKDHRPERAAQLANAIAESYKRQNVGHKVSAAQEAVDWLTRKLTELGAERERSSQALLDFKRSHDLLQAGLAERQNLIGQTIQSIEARVVEAKQGIETLRAEVEQGSRLKTTDALLGLERVANNDLIQRLKEQRLTLENQRSALLEQYLEGHPKVRVISDQLTRIDQAINREVKGIKRSTKRSLSFAQRALRVLDRELEQHRKKARELQSQEVVYRTLEGAVETNSRLYDQMQIRLKEAELQAQTTANNVRILDLALVPTRPVSPRLSLNLAAALASWLLLSFLIVLLRDMLDRTIRHQSELLERFGVVTLGVVPRIRRGHRPSKRDGSVRSPELYVLENPTSTVAEVIRTIRTNMIFMNPNRPLRTLMVTSAAPRDGKTLNSVNLSVAMALSGERVVLIDADLRRPRVHKVFGMMNDRGFTNMLVDEEVEPEEVSRATPIETLDVMTSGPLPTNPAELLQTPAFQRTIDRLLQEYDRVIFDSPPVVPVTDPQVIGRQVDGVVLVARVEKTQRDVFKRALELLRNVQVNLLGVVLNDMNATSGAYGYHYYYQYHQDQKERRLPDQRSRRPVAERSEHTTQAPEGGGESPSEPSNETLDVEDRFGH